MKLDDSWLLTDIELSEVSNLEIENNMMDLTSSPAWATALQIGLNLLPVASVFIP